MTENDKNSNYGYSSSDGEQLLKYLFRSESSVTYLFCQIWKASVLIWKEDDKFKCQQIVLY